MIHPRVSGHPLHDSTDAVDATWSAVVPRWELRVFARRLPRVRPDPAVSEARDPPRRETYFVSARSLQNVKIRADHVEIKRLEAVDGDGLERWRPTARHGFPLGSSDIADIGAALNVTFPGTLRAPVNRAGLLAAIASLAPMVVAVPLTKWRRQFVVAGCHGERVTLVVRGRHWESMALEDPDRDRVMRAAALLHLNDLPNTSYPAALKAIVGMPTTHLNSPTLEIG